MGENVGIYIPLLMLGAGVVFLLLFAGPAALVVLMAAASSRTQARTEGQKDC